VARGGHLHKPDRPPLDRLEEQKVRVLVVDDDLDFVEAAMASLAADRRIEVVGDAANGEKAVRQAAALRREVVAMDVVMPGLDGI
jgi:two-component system chemotaxis response regulator CheB